MLTLILHILRIMEIVNSFTSVEGSAGRLDTEQEREQEQEQEKEMEIEVEEEIQVEKFIEREYSRQAESQRPWPLKMLSQDFDHLPPGAEHPFYRLNNFQLRFHEPLNFSNNLLVSSNFFSPKWVGLRRIKNVVMVSHS